MSRRSKWKERADALLAGWEASGTRPKLLLHACCAPCSSYVLEVLAEHFTICVFYYNPNIYPPEEFGKRIGELERLIREMQPECSLIEGRYDPKEFYDAVRGFEAEKEGGKRCEICFRQRLMESALAAKEAGCDYFTTTLSISPHKNAEVINRIGEEIANETGVNWFPSDFKKNGGFQRSIELSTKYDLYRQEYCGCIYSIRNTQNRPAFENKNGEQPAGAGK